MHIDDQYSTTFLWRSVEFASLVVLETLRHGFSAIVPIHTYRHERDKRSQKLR